jgi:hypothetical protein
MAKPMSKLHKVLLGIIPIVVCVLEANAAGPYYPVVVSPLIGDTLDARERSAYGLLPGHPGFRWAVFFRERDYTVSALVGSERNGVSQETMVELRYTIAGLRQKIQRDQVQIVAESRERRGKDLVVYTRSGEKVCGELLSVREDALLIASEKYIPGSHFFGGMGYVRPIQFSEVGNVVIEGRSYRSGGAVVGAVAGGIVGGVIAHRSGDGGGRSGYRRWSGSSFFRWHFPFGDELGGAVIGASVGGLLGYAVGSAASTEDVVIAPEHIASLRSMARFDRAEPDQIRGL